MVSACSNCTIYRGICGNTKNVDVYVETQFLCCLQADLYKYQLMLVYIVGLYRIRVWRLPQRIFNFGQIKQHSLVSLDSKTRNDLLFLSCQQYFIFHLGFSTSRFISSYSTYVIVYTIDFSKAFDTVRHSELLGKHSRMELPDYVHNWLVDFFRAHTHCSRFGGVESEFTSISFIQYHSGFNSWASLLCRNRLRSSPTHTWKLNGEVCR